MFKAGLEDWEYKLGSGVLALEHEDLSWVIRTNVKKKKKTVRAWWYILVMAVLDRQRQVDSCGSLPTLTYLMSYGPVKDPIVKK